MSAASVPHGRRAFIAGLGVGQIVSWGTLYYSFPLIAQPMARDLGLDKPTVYAAATVGLLVASVAAWPVGAAIDRGRGRAVMAAGSLLAGLALFGWAAVDGVWSLYGLFALVGVVQAMTLYEPAFAVVARRYGAEARDGVTALTLWGGFASTVFVPLIQLLLDHLGWRETLVVLGLANLGIAALVHLLVIDPAADAVRTAPLHEAPPHEAPPLVGRAAVAWALRQPPFWGLAVAFVVYYAIFSSLTYHLYPLLLERGSDAATVVAVIAMIGPAQVAGRIAVWTFAGRRSIRAVGSATVAALPVALVMLAAAPAEVLPLALFAVLYGAANGIMTIVRGMAVPEMVTRDAYGAINGALAVPIAVAKALAPMGAALLWAADGSYGSVLLSTIVASGVMAAAFWFAAVVARRTGRA